MMVMQKWVVDEESKYRIRRPQRDVSWGVPLNVADVAASIQASVGVLPVVLGNVMGMQRH